jgi:hypothetical protein
MIIQRIVTPMVLAVVGLAVMTYHALRSAGFMNQTSQVLRRARASHSVRPESPR